MIFILLMHERFKEINLKVYSLSNYVMIIYSMQLQDMLNGGLETMLIINIAEQLLIKVRVY